MFRFNLGLLETEAKAVLGLEAEFRARFAKAIQILEQAIEADPNFAPAYQGLSYAYFIGSLIGKIDALEKFNPLAVNRLHARLYSVGARKKRSPLYRKP